MDIAKKTNRRWFILYLIISFFYFNWRFWFTIPLEDGLLSFVFGTLLLIAEAMGMFEFMIHFLNMSSIEVPIKPTIENEEDYPAVDVFVASYNEPTKLLYKTLVAAKHMDYPDKTKVNIFLLDDGNRESARKLCKHLKVGYLTRETNEHAKAGNINSAIAQTNSPYIVTLDADMIPMKSFLMETIPFFIKNEQQRAKELAKGNVKTKPLGFLQTPQAFYNPDVFQRYLMLEKEIPNEQDYFYRSIQVGKNKSNSVIYAGSNTVISREALESIGGFVTGIITEDIATGLNLQKQGYQSMAIPTVQATGLSPDDLRTIVKQRKRWGRGCIQTFKRFNPLFVKGLTLHQRLNYFDSLCYWYGSVKRFIFILAPILFTVFKVKVVDASLLLVLLFWIPMTIMIKKMFQLYSKDIRTAVWSDIYETIMMPSLMVAVLLETFGIKQHKFEVTDKEGIDKVTKEEKIRFALPHLILIGLTFYGILESVTKLGTGNWSFYVTALIWLFINLYNLIMAVIFALGKPLYQGERIYSFDGTSAAYLGDTTLELKLVGLSEGEVILELEEDDNLLDGERVEMALNINEKIINVLAEKIDACCLNGKCFSRFTYTVKEEADYVSLISLIFDREPDLPNKIEKKSRYYYLKRNIYHRFKLSKSPQEHWVVQLDEYMSI